MVDPGGPSIINFLLIALSIALTVSGLATVIHAFRHNRPVFGFLMVIFPLLVILYWVPTLGERRPETR